MNFFKFRIFLLNIILRLRKEAKNYGKKVNGGKDKNRLRVAKSIRGYDDCPVCVFKFNIEWC